MSGWSLTYLFLLWKFYCTHTRLHRFRFKGSNDKFQDTLHADPEDEIHHGLVRVEETEKTKKVGKSSLVPLDVNVEKMELKTTWNKNQV